MSYNTDFDRAFMERSLSLIKEYKGPFDATLLLNCYWDIADRAEGVLS